MDWFNEAVIFINELVGFGWMVVWLYCTLDSKGCNVIWLYEPVFLDVWKVVWLFCGMILEVESFGEPLVRGAYIFDRLCILYLLFKINVIIIYH